METSDITIQILTDIRDEIRSTNKRIDQTNSELRSTREELRAEIRTTNERIVGSEIRLATAITDMSGTLREVRDMLAGQRDLRDRVERCETDIAELKRRVPDLPVR